MEWRWGRAHGDPGAADGGLHPGPSVECLALGAEPELLGAALGFRVTHGPRFWCCHPLSFTSCVASGGLRDRSLPPSFSRL